MLPVEVVVEGVALRPADPLQFRFVKEFAHPTEAEIGDRDDMAGKREDFAERTTPDDTDPTDTDPFSTCRKPEILDGANTREEIHAALMGSP